ncbi:hypothetical protein [Candidatus Liberibacter sp.]|uniref:hypothetical protein n=1 Tax=Candidatus Liberibacter sp. TaxID=34022 RepID=UPI0015F3DB96|nr:hypothetical protein [Candidatus Liberibacter sp.]MBA5724501.1 hypothetical protein [Candidatus Liberibacter sp.]
MGACFEKVDARFEQLFKEIGNVPVEMRNMIWKILSVIAVIMTVSAGLLRFSTGFETL